MTKRIFKVLGIVLAGVFALVGVIVGVLAATGQFRSDPIYPARLFFEQDVLQIQYDENDSSKLYSFRLSAESDKAKEVNQRTCYISLDRNNQVNNQDLIILTDSKGQALTPESDGFYYKVNCNQPIYYKVNSSAVEQTYPSNKAEYGIVTVSGEARRSDGSILVSSQNSLRIEIDIAANKLVLNTSNKQAQLSADGQTQTLKIDAGSPLDFDFEISPNNALLPIYDKHAKEVELYFDNRSEGKYILITEQNCADYDLQWVGNPGWLGSENQNRNIYHSGYRFLSNSKTDSTNYNFVAVMYPTYFAQKDDTSTWDENTVYERHISQLPHLNISLSVQFANIESVNMGSSAQLNVNVPNELSLSNLGITMSGAGSEDRYNNIVFKLSNFEHLFLTNSNLVFGAESASDLYFNNQNSYSISGSTLTDNNTQLRYTISLDSRLTLVNSLGVKYQLVSGITATDTTTSYKAKYGAIFVRTANQTSSLVVLGSGSYMDFFKQENDNFTTATDFDYTVSPAVRNEGVNNSFIITANNEMTDDSLALLLFVVNSDGTVVLPSNACKITINPKFNTPTRLSPDLTLTVGYDANGRIFNSTDIDELYTFNTKGTSYNGFALVTLETDAKYFETITNIQITNGNLSYRLVGYFDDDQFVNAVKATSEIIDARNLSPKLYPILLKTNDITSYITQSTTSVDYIMLGNNAIANESLAVSAHLSLNIGNNDLDFNFVTDTYSTQTERGIEYMFFGDYLTTLGDTATHTINITSNVNDLQIADLLKLFEDNKNLIAFASSTGNMSTDGITVANTTDGNNTITITFDDLVSSPSSSNSYHFALNIGGERQIRCNTNVYFVPNTPNNIILRIGDQNVSLAATTETAGSTARLKITIGWDDENYTYKYEIIDGEKTYEITDINALFNSTTAAESVNRFYATPYETLTRKLSYTATSTDGGNYFTLGQDGKITTKVVGVTTETGYSVINITCETITRYLKVEVVAENGFTASANKNDFVENNSLNLISNEYLDYKNGEQKVSIDEAFIVGIDNIVSGVKNYEVEITDKTKTLNEIGDSVVAGIKVGDNYLVKIEYKDGDLVLTRDKYQQTDLQFELSIKLKTEQQPTKISIRFSPSLSINESPYWSNFYAGTTVLLYKTYTDASAMSTDTNRPIYKILDKANSNNIKVKYLHGDNVDGDNYSNATAVNNGGELQLQAGKYKFFFFKGDESTPMELDYEYTFTVLDNAVAVLKTNTINLKSATDTQLNSLIDLYSYKTDDNIVYGKTVDNSTKMYSDGDNLQKITENNDYSKLSIGSKDDDSDNLLTIVESNFKVGWVSELNYNNTITLNLHYNNNPIAIWINGTDLTKQDSNDILVNITNAYKVEISLENGLQTYIENAFDDVFSVTTDNTNNTLKITNVDEQASNPDIKFKMLTDTNKFYAYIENPSQILYHISVSFTFIVDGVENTNTLTGTFTFDVRPYVPEITSSSDDFYIEGSYDMIKTIYGGQQDEEVDFITSIVITAVNEHNGYNIGYQLNGGEWKATNAGTTLTLSRDLISLNEEQVNITITIKITYLKDDISETYEYLLTITVKNNQAIQINYPLDTTTSEKLTPQTIDNMTLVAGGTGSEVFDKYEVVPLKNVVSAQTSPDTTIDLAYDSFLDLSRVMVWNNQNGYSRLPSDQNTSISLYAYKTGRVAYGNVVKISGTQITFSLPTNYGDTTTMYFVFKITYQNASAQYYKVQAEIISDNDNLSQTNFRNNIDLGVVYDENNNQIIDTSNDDIKLLGKSIKTNSDDNQLIGNIDGLFGNKNYSTSNLQFYLVNAKTLVDGSAENLVKIGEQEIAIGGLVNGKQAATLTNPTQHLTLRLMVVYCSADENKFIPVGTVTAYVSPTNNENGTLDDLATLARNDQIVTGEYNVDLNKVGVGGFSIIEAGKGNGLGINSVEIVTDSVSAEYKCEQTSGMYTIKFTDDNTTQILTLTNGEIDVKSFVSTDLKFTAIYTLSNGTKIKVNYSLTRIAPTKTQDNVTLGNNYNDGFNNYLTVSNYVPTDYNGKVSFTFGDKTSKSVNYTGMDSAQPSNLQQADGNNIEVEGHAVTYGYKDGKLVLYFIQDQTAYNFNITIKLDNLAVKSAAEAQANIAVQVTTKLHIERNETTDLNSPHTLSAKTDFKQSAGSSIYVAVEDQNGKDTRTFTIYDGDSHGTKLVTIITTSNSQLQITFKGSDNTISDKVQKIVLNNNNVVANGVANITNSTTINFAHLANDFTLILDLVVSNAGTNLNQSNTESYYIKAPQTYTLTPAYQVKGAAREIVSVNEQYYLKPDVNEGDTKYASFFDEYTETNESAVKDVASKTSILNQHKFALQYMLGSETQTIFDYDVSAMGFLDDNSINKITISDNGSTGSVTFGSDTNGQFISFGSASQASVTLQNAAGVNVIYHFNVMQNGNGIDKAQSGGEIFSTTGESAFNYVSLIIDDNDNDSFKLSGDGEKYGKVIGQVRDGDANVFHITDLQALTSKDGALTQVSSEITRRTGDDSEIVDNDVIVQYEFTIQPLTFTITYKNDNSIYLDLSRNSGSKIEIAALQLTMYGNSKIESGFRIYLFNVKESVNAGKLTDVYGYSENSINLGEIYNYTFNTGESGKIDKLSYEIDMQDSSANLNNGGSSSFDLSHVFSSTTIGNDNALKLNTLLQDVKVHLKINVKYTFDENTQIIIDQQANCDFTVKRGVSLFFKQGDNDYKEIGTDTGLVANYKFLSSNPSLPYSWDITQSYTYGNDNKTYQIVACRLDKSDSSREVSLQEYLNNVTISNGDDLGISYADGKITFAKDINNNGEYTFTFLTTSHDTTNSQQLRIKIQGYVGVESISTPIGDGNGFKAGTTISLAKNNNDATANTGLTLTINADLDDNKKLQLNYQYAIISSSAWSTSSLGSLSYGEQQSLDISKNSIPTITLPATSINDAYVVYKTWITYIGFDSTNENVKTADYYVAYKLKGINYISDFNTVEDHKYNSVDVDNGLISSSGEENKTVLPLTYFKQTYTASEVQARDTKQAVFTLIYDNNELKQQLEFNSSKYVYNKETKRWENTATEQTDYFDVDSEFNKITHQVKTDGELYQQDKQYTLTIPEYAKLDSVNVLFTLATDININDYLTFANALIGQNSSLKFVGDNGSKLDSSSGVADGLKESYEIKPFEVNNEVVLGVDLSGDSAIFNGRLNCKLVIELNGNQISLSDNTFSLYTQNEIVAKATTLHKASEIFTSTTDQTEILGIYKTGGNNGETTWVKVNSGNGSITAEYNSQVEKTYTLGDKTYPIHTITYKLSDESENSLYTNTKTFYVIESESDSIIAVKSPSFNQQVATSSSQITFDVSTNVFTEWKMNNGELTSNGYSGEITITAKEDNPITGEDNVTINNNDKTISVSVEALNKYFTEHSANSVTLRFTISVNGQTYDISISYNKQIQ